MDVDSPTNTVLYSASQVLDAAANFLVAADAVRRREQGGKSAEQRIRDGHSEVMLQHMDAPAVDQMVLLMKALEACDVRAWLSLSRHVPLAKAAATSSLAASSSSSSIGKKRGRPVSCRSKGCADSPEIIQLLAKQMQCRSLLAQHLFAASVLGVSMPAAEAAVCADTFTWDADGNLVSCSHSSKLSEAQAAALVNAAGSPEYEDAMKSLAIIMQHSRQAAHKMRSVQHMLENCAQVKQQEQRQQQEQEQQQEQQQEQEQQPAPAAPPGPSRGLSRLAALAAAAYRGQVKPVGDKVEEFLKAYDAQDPTRVFSDEAWQRLLGHPLVVEYHTDTLCPVFMCVRASSSSSSSSGGGGSNSRPCGMHSPLVTCKQCSECLCSSHSTMLHVCSHRKLLQPDQLASLADVAGCKPVQDGKCFLCRCAATDGEAHACNSILWRLLAVDQSQLFHANPAEDPRVLSQGELLRVRRHCHIIVQNVFMCPEAYLQDSTGMLRDGTWPLLRFLMVIGPSCLVKGQRGGFALLPPDHWGGELLAQKGGTFTLSAALQGELKKQQEQRSSGGGQGYYTAPFVPHLSRSLAGCYTGALRDCPHAGGDEDDLAVTGLMWGGAFHWFVDPRQVGSPHVLFNQAHNRAAVLHTLHLTFPRQDRTRTQPQMFMQAVQRSSDGLAEEQRKRQQRQQQQGAGLVELTWDYQAQTTNPQDPLLDIDCLCESCTRAKTPPKQLVTLAEQSRARRNRRL